MTLTCNTFPISEYIYFRQRPVTPDWYKTGLCKFVIETISNGQFMGIWLAGLYTIYATQSLPQKRKVFIFVQYINCCLSDFLWLWCFLDILISILCQIILSSSCVCHRWPILWIVYPAILERIESDRILLYFAIAEYILMHYDYIRTRIARVDLLSFTDV